MSNEHRRRRHFSVLAVSALVAGVGLSTASPAAAVGACDTGAFCAYQLNDLNASGHHFEDQGNGSSWPSGVSNAENSVYNHGTSGKAVRVYDFGGYIDTHYCVFKDHSLNLPSNKDEDGQSHQWLSGLSGCF
jgi:Peptidase inhibitor family I36